MTSNVDEFLSRFGVKDLKHSEDGVTNTTAVIVALPSAVDPIRLVGDEDKHATILFFGETSTLPDGAKDKILAVLKQAATMFEPFSEPIRDISRLGSDVPPALVAMLAGRCLLKLHDVFKIVPDINSYLLNAQQYPSYTPHVTLGYPDWQGEAELRQKVAPLGVISFDRLALWWNDEHIEFPLRPQNDWGSSENVMAQMDDVVENFLAHHGIKGQKWGVRRTAAQLSGFGGSRKVTLRDGTVVKVGRADQKAMAGARVGASGVVRDKKTGAVHAIVKRKDGKWHEADLSEDAVKFAAASQKHPLELTDAELRDHLARARILKEYDQFFGVGRETNQNPNAELKSKVEKLQLEKQMSELNAALTPSRSKKAKSFVNNMETAYKAYNVIDKATGKAFSGHLNAKVKTILGEVEKVKK